MITPTRPRRRDDVIVAETPGEGVFLLDPVAGEYFALEDVGRFVWERCDGVSDIASIAAAVRASFAGAPDNVDEDVRELIEDFAATGLLEHEPAG